MAWEDIRHALGQFLAGADLTGDQYKFVKLDPATSKIVRCDTAGEFAFGVLQNKPNLNQAATVADVASGDVTKLVASAAIAVGALVATTNDGRAKTATKGSTDTSDAGVAADPLKASFALGYALEAAAAAGDIIAVLLVPMGAAPTTAQ